MISKKDKSFILLVVASLIVIWILYTFTSSVVKTSLLRNDKNYQLLTTNDLPQNWFNVTQPLKEADLHNRLILLDFWTYSCVSCLQMMPEIKKLETEFADQLTVLGVHSGKFTNDKDSQAIRNAIIKYDITHPVINDADYKIWNGFNVKSWPTLILLTPGGDIAKIYTTENDLGKIRSDIKKLARHYRFQLHQNPLPLVLEKNKIVGYVLKYPSKLEYAANLRYKNINQPAIFIANSGAHNIVITSLSGEILLKIGAGQGFQNGKIADAKFNNPQGMIFKNNILYVADTGNHSIRRLDFDADKIETVAGKGSKGLVIQNKTIASTTFLASPSDLEFFPDQNNIIIANAGTNQLLRYNLTENMIIPFAGKGSSGISDGKYPKNSLAQPSALKAYGGKLYFLDSVSSALRVVNQNGEVTTLIGQNVGKFGKKNGDISQALMQNPLGLTADDTGIYIADSLNHSIRRYDHNSRKLSDYSGDGKRGDELGTNHTSYDEPSDIIGALGSFYVADNNNNRIVRIDRKNIATSLLEVMPPLQLSKEVFLEYLPNLEQIPAAEVKSDSVINLVLILKEGWKINDLAPSFFNLIEIQKDKEANLIASFDWNAINTGLVKLPKLSDKNQYYLQGTIYYCEDKPGALCLIHSYEQKLLPKSGSTNTSIKVNFVYNE